MKTIKLYGVLAKKFGKLYRFDVESPKEAIRALCSQLEGFESFMNNAHHQGLAFAVFNDNRNIGLDEVSMNTGADVIKIVPKVMGAGGNNGILQVILGAVLVVAGYFTFGSTTQLGASMIAAGVGVAIGGVAQMLMPTPKMNDFGVNEDGNRPNYGFGSAVTTTAQGNPVPILYGERLIGGFIVSAGVFTEDNM